MKSKTDLRNDTADVMENFARLARAHLIASLDQLLVEFADDASASPDTRRRPNQLDVELVRTYERLKRASQALTIWHSHDDFLGPDGTPKALPMAGRVSLRSLAQRVTGRNGDVNSLTSDLESLGLIQKRTGGYIPARRSAVVAHRDRVSLAYATNAIARLISTIAHNYSRPAMPRFERQVADAQIPLGDLPPFLRFVEQQGQYLIDAVDDWLHTRQVKSGTRGDCVSVGIGAFAWAGAGNSQRVPSQSTDVKVAPPKLR